MGEAESLQVLGHNPPPPPTFLVKSLRHNPPMVQINSAITIYTCVSSILEPYVKIF